MRARNHKVMRGRASSSSPKAIAGFNTSCLRHVLWLRPLSSRNNSPHLHAKARKRARRVIEPEWWKLPVDMASFHGRAATTVVRGSSWTQQFSNNFHGRCKNGSVFRFHFCPSESDSFVLSGTRGTIIFHMASEAPKRISWPRTTVMYKHKPQDNDNIAILCTTHR